MLQDPIIGSTQQMQQYLDIIKSNILSRQFPRRSLQTSCTRLILTMCSIYEQKTHCAIGHPYHKLSLLSYHKFSQLYSQWKHNKFSFNLFEKLCDQLSRLIYNNVIDFYVIMEMCPEIVIQMSGCFRKIIEEGKDCSITGQNGGCFYDDDKQRSSVSKICDKYVSIICQYYQLLKNKNIQDTQQKILYLLQQVFSKSKVQLSKQMIMNPFSYLESISPQSKQQITINCGVELFRLDQQINQINTKTINVIQNLDKQYLKCLKMLYENNKNYMKKNYNPNQESQTKSLLIKEADGWDRMEEEKEIYQDQKEMYMEIQQEDEQQFNEQSDQKIDQIISQKQQISQKSIQKDKNILNINQANLNNITEHNTQQNTQILLTRLLLNKKSSKNNNTISIKHYDFLIQLAKALFRKQNYITSTNVYFYIGLFYNLLKIIQDNLRECSNKNKQSSIFNNIQLLIKQIDNRISNVDYSVYFMVLNYFISPKYQHQHGVYKLKSNNNILTTLFISYYINRMERFTDILINYQPLHITKLAKLSEVIQFKAFQHLNQLYNLGFLSNLYLSYRKEKNEIMIDEHLTNKIKEQFLFRVVKYNLPILRNIMIYQKWEHDLSRAKILVSFEKLVHINMQVKEQGIQMLYQCATKSTQNYIEELVKDQSKINLLEELILIGENSVTEKIQKKIFQLLDIYYKN